MIWLRQNKFLGGFLIGLLVATIFAAYFLLHEKGVAEEARITITLNQIPLGEALRYIASQAGLKVKVEPYAVSIIPINEQSADLFTKEYRVPPASSAARSMSAPTR